MRTGRSNGPQILNGILLTAQGHILVQDIIPPDTDDRIEAWVGEDEYQARPLKVDEHLGMTILKIESDEPFPPITWSGRLGTRVRLPNPWMGSSGPHPTERTSLSSS